MDLRVFRETENIFHLHRLQGEYFKVGSRYCLKFMLYYKGITFIETDWPQQDRREGQQYGKKWGLFLGTVIYRFYTMLYHFTV
jgi:hypothetical protein